MHSDDDDDVSVNTEEVQENASSDVEVCCMNRPEQKLDGCNGLILWFDVLVFNLKHFWLLFLCKFLKFN